jgi:hypothetical protein
VDGRIANVHGDRVATVTLDDRRQPACDLGERLLPGGRAQVAVAADQRPAQAVGVVVQVAERRPLGQMNPRLKTSSRSPRIRVTAPSPMVSSRPHVASQSGHVLKTVVSADADMGHLLAFGLVAGPQMYHMPPRGPRRYPRTR